MDFILYITILIYSIILHEIAHGYVAYKNGDDTAFRSGRLTLNPLSHISMVGSIIVPVLAYFSFGVPFGWAKPVPYRPEIISKNKFGELAVSSAGVLMNYFLVFLAVIINITISHFNLTNQDIFNGLYLIASINIILGTFNLLPFPPADGWHIFTELYRHIKDFYFKIKSKISKKYIYSPYYINNNINNLQNKMNAIFYNPIFMIASIYIAVQVFDVFVKYIVEFLNWLFTLQF